VTSIPPVLTFGAYALPSYHADSDPPQGEFMRHVIDLLAAAEPLGFDSIWINEHHFDSWGGLMSAPALALAALSQRTRRVRLGTSIAVLGLHHPLAVAEQMATLDLLSNGRLDFGVGRGSEAYDYEAFSIDYAEAQARTLESLDVILAAWTRARVTHPGTYFQVEDVEVWPRPQQSPHPPVWLSVASSQASFEYAARRGFNALTLGFPRPVSEFAELTRSYRSAWVASGHAQDGYQLATLYHTIVCENGERARQLAITHFGRFLVGLRASATRPTRRPQPTRASASLADVDLATLITEARLIAGNPQEVADMLRYLQDEVGFTQLNHMFQFGGLSFDVAHESMALYAREVMPRLRTPVPSAA
jgi:alkanesulfonate monooxygenase SsuD/methylene tetrahydromethanopterin reductase-like flavin-dependent oxidoreductase (luciferase family)